MLSPVGPSTMASWSEQTKYASSPVRNLVLKVSGLPILCLYESFVRFEEYFKYEIAMTISKLLLHVYWAITVKWEFLVSNYFHYFNGGPDYPAAIKVVDFPWLGQSSRESCLR